MYERMCICTYIKETTVQNGRNLNNGKHEVPAVGVSLVHWSVGVFELPPPLQETLTRPIGT